jgi:hypothetical protein
MTAIQLFCPICGQKLSVETAALRSRTTCPRCAKSFVPVEAIPREQTLPVIAAGEAFTEAPPASPADTKQPEDRPGPLAGQVKTILMPPNGGPLPLVGVVPPPPPPDAVTLIKAPEPKPAEALPAPFEEPPTEVKAPPAEASPAPVEALPPGPEIPVAAEPTAAPEEPKLPTAIAPPAGRTPVREPLHEKLLAMVLALPPRTRLIAAGGVLFSIMLILLGIVALASGGGRVEGIAAHLHAPKIERPELPPEQRADYKLKRDGHVPASGGVLHVPQSFRSDDGAFDLYMHFHGNTQLVEESVAAAGVNALVWVVNLGDGSGRYEDKYSVAGMLDQTIDKIQETAKNRGLRGAKVRRVALGSWSAGYGALSKLLDVEKNVDRIDAVLVLDGIHVAYADPKAKTVDLLRLGPFVRFAKLAADDKRLFTITHSDIQGASYASTSETADALLHEVGAERTQAQATPPKVTLPTALAALPKPQEVWLEQTSEAKKGGLHVRGYSGQTPEQHMAHLVQMSVTVLPELAERWR